MGRPPINMDNMTMDLWMHASRQVESGYKDKQTRYDQADADGAGGSG